MPKRSNARWDVNKVAASVVSQATGSETEKNPAAVALGRLGGMKGGPARAAALTKSQRSEIAKKAARTRWAKKRA